jgi:hypothetical protein
MATLGLSIVGTYFGGPVGGFIGAAIGGAIDNFLLFPALFPKPTIEGQRLQDKQLQSASEGSEMKWVLGPLNRVGGTVIWMSDLIEEKEEEEVGKGGGGQKVTNYRYFVDIAIAVCSTEGLPGNKIDDITQIMADAKVLFGDGSTGRFEEIHIYKGDQTSPDPLIESYKGAGNVPIYKKTCYVVIKKLALADFGNRIPFLTFFVRQQGDMALKDAAKLILNRYGFTDDEVITDRLPHCFEGYTVSGPQVGDSVLTPLVQAYRFGFSEDAGVITLVARGYEDEVTVSTNDLATHEFGKSTSRKVRFEDADSTSVPGEILVRFVSDENNLQQGSERAFRKTDRNPTIIDLPLTLSPAIAKGIAKVNLWSAQTERVPVTLNLPPSMIHVQETDIVKFTLDGVEYSVYVAQLTRGYNHLIEIQGVLTRKKSFLQTGEYSAPTTVPGAEETVPEERSQWYLDAPAFTDGLTEQLGVYFVSESDPWAGVRSFKGEVGGPSTTREGYIGEVLAPLEPMSPYVWDEDSRLVVEMKNGTLSPCSEEECLSGTNRAAIRHPSGDWEIIGYQNVTNSGYPAGTYEISKLLRGLRGTEHLVSGHLAGEPFIKLSTDGSVGFHQCSISELNTNLVFKAVPFGSTVSEWDSTTVQFAGKTKRPFSVVDLTYEWDSSDNLTVTWNRRSKKFSRLFSPAPLSADENPMQFLIEVKQGGPLATPVRSVVVNEEKFVYSAADMTADGYSPSTPGTIVKVYVYQLSSEVGRGQVASIFAER